MNKEQLEKHITNILYMNTDQNEMKIREVDFEEVVKDVVKLFKEYEDYDSLLAPVKKEDWKDSIVNAFLGIDKKRS